MKKSATFSLSAFTLLGLVKILSIVPFTRMAADDFSSALMARLGVWQSLVATYNTSIGRFSSILIETLFVTFLGINVKIWMFSVITLFLVFISFVIFFKRFLKVDLNKLYIYLLAGVAMVTLYLLTPSKSESWYWLTGAVTYLWPIPIFLIGVSYIFLEKLKKIDFVLSSLLVFISVACNETFGFLVVIFLLSLLLGTVFKKKFNKLILFMFISSLVSFAIMYFSPGNDARRQNNVSNPMSLLGSLMYSIKEGPEFLFVMVKNSWYILLPLLFVLSYIFTQFKTNIQQKFESIEELLVNTFILIVYSVFLSIFYMLPAFNNLGRVQPERSGITMSMIIVMLTVGVAFNVAQILNIQRLEKKSSLKFIVFLASTILFLGSFNLTSTLAKDFYIAKNYSLAYDNMISSFEKAAISGGKTDMEVSLPDPGLVAITLDPPGVYGYKNQAMSEFFRIGRVLTKENE